MQLDVLLRVGGEDGTRWVLVRDLGSHLYVIPESSAFSVWNDLTRANNRFVETLTDMFPFSLDHEKSIPPSPPFIALNFLA